MAFFDFLNPVLDIFFGPLLNLVPIWAMLVLSAVLSLLITLVYKWTTNQTMMKQLKDDVKKYQTEMKANKHDQKKVLEIQGKAMNANMQLMKHSFRPTLITLLPIIIIFGWVSGHFNYDPIMPGQQFQLLIETAAGVTGSIDLQAPSAVNISNITSAIQDGKAQFTLQAPEGDWLVRALVNNQTYEKQVRISKSRTRVEKDLAVNDKTVKQISVSYADTVVLDLFGWKLGWIGTYILFSIVFSMGLRKLLKVY